MQTIAPAITEPDENGWVKAESFEVDPGGYVGDEPTTAKGYDVRYTRPDGDNFLVITILYYVNTEVEDEYGVRSMTTTTRCTDAEDPGNSEISSDIEYDSADARAFDNAEAAEETARACALEDERYKLT